MRQAFRILIIDDNEATLNELQAHLARTIEIDDTSRRIEPCVLRITYQQEGGKWHIGGDTLLALATLCEAGRFDYIFADYAYIADVEANESLRAQLIAERRDVTDDDVRAFTLTLHDLYVRFQEVRKTLSRKAQQAIDNNFLGHTGHVQIYTLSPTPFASYFYPAVMPERRTLIASVFTETTRIDPFILMHDDYCIPPEVHTAFHDPQEQRSFVTALLSRRLQALMHIAALEDIVHAQRHLRVEVTSKAFGTLTNEALAFGAVVALFGEAIYHFVVRTVELTFDRYATATLKALVEQSFAHSLRLNLLLALVVLLVALVVSRRWGMHVAHAVENTVHQLAPGDADSTPQQSVDGVPVSDPAPAVPDGAREEESQL